MTQPSENHSLGVTFEDVVVARCDRPTIKGRHWPQHILEQIAEQYKTIYVAGEAAHTGTLPLREISHEASNLRFEYPCLICDIHKLDTDASELTDYDEHTHFHIYGVGEIDDHNVIQQFELVGIGQTQGPIYHDSTQQ